MRSPLPQQLVLWLARHFQEVPLRLVLVVPFMVEIITVVGLTGYLSFRNGQEAVNKIAAQLRDETTARVTQYLDSYLAMPALVNQINADAVRSKQLDFADPTRLERQFLRQLQQFSTVNSILVGTEQGTLRGLYRTPQLTLLRSTPTDPSRVDQYLIDLDGELGQTIKPLQNYNLRQRPWYRVAVEANRPVRVPIFPLANNSGFSLNASFPVYDRDTGELRGVFSAASDLSYLQRFLTSLRVGQTGRVFVLERNGLVIGTSATEQLQTPRHSSYPSSLERFRAVDSADPLIQSTSRYLISEFNTLDRIVTPQKLTFWHDDDRQFVQVAPYRDALGLDWLIVVVVSESDFTAEVNANTRTTAWLCAIALLAAIGLGLLTAYWIAQPIVRLSRVSRALALGNWEQPPAPGSPIAELDVLARSFHQMTEHLQASFGAARAVQQESEEKFTKIFRASSDSIAIATLGGKFLEVNDSFLSVFGYSRAEVVGRTAAELGLWEPVFNRSPPAQVKRLEYQFRRKSGAVLTVLLSSEFIDVNGEPCLLGIATIDPASNPGNLSESANNP